MLLFVNQMFHDIREIKNFQRAHTQRVINKYNCPRTFNKKKPIELILY